MKAPLRASEAADLIQRFLTGAERYPQEWNDFVEAIEVERAVEPYRNRCYELDPMVNRPGSPDIEAVEELKKIASALRNMSATLPASAKSSTERG